MNRTVFMIPALLSVFCFGWPGRAQEPASGTGQTKANHFYDCNFDGDEANQWQAESEGLRIHQELAPRPGSSENNRCLVIETTAPGKSLRVNGPVIPMEKADPAVTIRLLRVNVKLRAQGLPDGAAQLRFQKVYGGKKGGWTITTRPSRDWDRLIDMGQAEKWADWLEAGNAGKLENNVTGIIPVVLITAEKAGGKLYLDDLSLDDDLTVNHLFDTGEADNIIPAGSGAATVKLANPETLASGKIRVRDELGQELTTRDIAAGEREVALELSQPGFYEMEVDAAYTGGGRVVSGTTVIVAGEPLDEALRRASPFGICQVHGSTKTMVKLGANWGYGIGNWSGARLEADGTIVPPKTPGKSEDIRLTWASNGGDLPDWLTGGGEGMRPPKDWNQLHQLVKSMIASAETLPDVIACANESDAHWRGSFDDFVRFHRTFIDAAREARPDAVISGPCMYSIRMRDIRKYDEAGMLKGLDAFMMHAYVNATAPEGEFIERIQELTDYLQQTGRGDMPIYLTEFGWTSPPGDWQKPVDEITKARFMSRALTLCATYPQLKGLVYFALRFASEGGPGYGIMDGNNHPLPAAAAYATLTRNLTACVGKGQWLRLSPTRSMVVFPKGEHTLAVAWDAAADGEQELPAAPLDGLTMTGGALISDAVPVAVSPSPIYLTLPGAGLLNLPKDEGKKLLPGNTVTLDAERVLTVPGLSWSKGTLSVASTAELGMYLALYEKNGVWRGLPLTVQAPLSIRNVAWDWDGTQGGQARVEIETVIPEGCQVAASAQLAADGTPLTSSATAKVTPGQMSIVALPFSGLKPGLRYTGQLTVKLAGGALAWEVAQPVESTFVPCPRLAQEPDDATWGQVPAVEFSHWEPLPEAIPAEDCSASVKLATSPEGIHIRVAVRDEEHSQKPGWSYMWKGDSVQIAFDVDAEKEWQPNNVGNGINGHRVFQYGFSLGDSGEPMAWRFVAEAPGRKNGPEFNIRPVIVRDEQDKTTHYAIDIPWAEIALDEQPAAGKQLGFSLTVNDMDAGKKRRMLQLFRGICSGGGGPVNYGRIWMTGAEPAVDVK